MKMSQLSLRTRIFVAMILLILIASVLIAAVSIFQYREEATEYHADRLERKEARLKIAIANALKSTTYPVTAENIPLIFRERDKIYQIAEEHSLPVYIYNLEGELIIKSEETFEPDTTAIKLATRIIDTLAVLADKRFLVQSEKDGENFLSSYTYIIDNRGKPLAILNLPYLKDNKFINRELIEFLERLGSVYVLMLLIAIVLAYFLSRFITKSINAISTTLDQTRLDKQNKRIEIKDTGAEIYALVTAYNSMIDELEESATLLAKNEREAAWREMAKQVAHEIKNPLTPMRLTVQSFQRKFDPEDPDIHLKVQEYSNTLIEQIDTMSAIASAFSNFAQMPEQHVETLDVVAIVGLALDIFSEEHIVYRVEEPSIIAKFDRTQLIRIVTNLVTNARQSIPEDRIPEIIVTVSTVQEDKVRIAVADNGIGITETNAKKIFEPKFTTKTSGMGLGLAMVKKIVEAHDGTITFKENTGKGTIFIVLFPKHV